MSYRIRVKEAQRALTHLLDTSTEERSIQSFLEAHPWMLTRQTRVRPELVITQLPLGVDHRPDFVFFWGHSGGDFISLIEIEPPSLQIFTADDEFSAPFNHALQQLEDWSIWIKSNSDYVAHMLKPLTEGFATSVPTFDWVDLRLIAGRRSQINSTKRERRWEERVNRAQRDTGIRTYDGFIESVYTAHKPEFSMPCLRYANQSYTIIST